MFGWTKTIGDAFISAWYSLWIFIDNLIYSLIAFSYQLFKIIAKASLYNSENADITTMVNRISVILGIGMLFILAYNIILNIMNPDKISAGGDKSMQGILKNAVIAIVMLTAYSMVFTYMTKIQNHIIDDQVIENIILGTGNGSSELREDSMGSKVAVQIFTAFFYPINDNGDYVDCWKDSSLDVCEAYKTGVTNAQTGTISDLAKNSTLFDSLKKDTPHINYLYIISSISGVVALLMFVSYVFDIGIRVAKMAFLQIIAPIPIMAYIVKPSGGVFSKWLDNLIKTYLSLFMRLITIYFAMFLINILATSVGNNTGGVFGNSEGVTGFVKLLANVVLIIGVLLFAKDAPKLLENLLGTTFGEGGGFSPKAIAKKLSGVREAPGVGGIIGKGLDKANQGIGAAAGAAGGAWSALRNNAAMKVGNKLGLKSAKELTHMSTSAAAKQGAAKGYAGGGIKQFKEQGESMYVNTYNYGKKQGFFGGKSFGTKINEKYGKAYENNVKQHAKEQNAAIRDKAIGNEIPGENDVASARMKANDYMAQNAEFAANSQTYKNAAAEVDREAATKGITLSPEERKAKINEKLSQISATTTNANEKRLIDSYLSRESVIADYNSSILAGNKDAIAKVKAEADAKTKAFVKAEIDSKGLQAAISDQSVRLQLEGNAKVQADGIMASVKGDISKLNIDSSSMGKINATAVANVDTQITAAGGVGNITLTADQQANVNSAIQTQVTETIAKAGGSEKIALDATNQATFAATEQTMKASATSEVESRLSAEFTQADETKIRNEIYSKSTVDEGGIIRNLSPQELKAKADQAVADAKADKRQKIVGEVFDKFNDEIAKVRDNLVQKQVANACNKDEITRNVLIQQQQTEGARQFVYDQQLRAGVEEQLYRDNYDNVERKVMIEANEAAANIITAGVLKHEEGRITGIHTNDKDGKIDKVYNAEYAQNERTSKGDIKTKSPEELAWDKIKKAVLDKDKK